ncbi:hypothetical protein Tcan_00745, partial [Toxocara canis]
MAATPPARINVFIKPSRYARALDSDSVTTTATRINVSARFNVPCVKAKSQSQSLPTVTITCRATVDDPCFREERGRGRGGKRGRARVTLYIQRKTKKEVQQIDYLSSTANALNIRLYCFIPYLSFASAAKFYNLNQE